MNSAVLPGLSSRQPSRSSEVTLAIFLNCRLSHFIDGLVRLAAIWLARQRYRVGVVLPSWGIPVQLFRPERHVVALPRPGPRCGASSPHAP